MDSEPDDAYARLPPAARAWFDSGRRVNVGRRRVFVYERGAGPVLLLLHGFPTSCYDWLGVIDRLASRFRCVAFDFLGYGLSDKPDDTSYSLFEQADVAEGVAAALGIAEAGVVSHDMGTSVHCELLARAGAGRLGFAIRSSTFTNGSMMQWLATITPFQKLLAANDQLPTAMKLCATGMPDHASALRALMKRPEAWSREEGEVVEALLAHRDGHLRIPALAGYMRERYVHRDRWLGAIEAARDRAQIVWATDDPIANAAMGRAMHERFPQAAYTELPDIGHFLIVEDPDAVADRIAEFDRRIAASAGSR